MWITSQVFGTMDKVWGSNIVQDSDNKHPANVRRSFRATSHMDQFGIPYKIHGDTITLHNAVTCGEQAPYGKLYTACRGTNDGR